MKKIVISLLSASLITFNCLAVNAAPVISLEPQNESVEVISEINKMENEVVRLVNVERKKKGLAPLTANAQLSNVARLKSQDMINKKYFSHYSPTYGSPFDMMKKFGIKFSYAGENIAMGQTTPAAVMKSWMNSPGHRANILNANYNQIGVGAAKSNRIYWTQMFIKK